MQGDSFFFVFRYARDAVSAAAEGQRALAEHAWESQPINVRIGLHTGEPMQADGLYAGLDVHQAARVMSAGHGGQILLSARTAELVEAQPGLELAQPRRAPAQRPASGAASLPGRRQCVPAAEDDLQHEPAATCELVRREGDGAGRGRRADQARRPPRHAHGPWRRRQDAARDRGSRNAPALVRQWDLLGRARLAPRPSPCQRDDRLDDRRERRSRHRDRRASVAPRPRQLRAGRRGGARALRLAAHVPEAGAPRHEPRAPAGRRRNRVRRAAATGTGGGGALLRALSAPAERGDPRALPPPRLAPTRARARRGAHEGA